MRKRGNRYLRLLNVLLSGKPAECILCGRMDGPTSILCRLGPGHIRSIWLCPTCARALRDGLVGAKIPVGSGTEGVLVAEVTVFRDIPSTD